MPEFKLVDVVARRRTLDEEYTRAKSDLDKQYKPKLEALDAYLMKYLVDNRQKTVATEAGTVMTYARRNVKVADFDNFKAWCDMNEKAEFIKHSVDSTEVLAYLDGGTSHLLPDGLHVDSTDVLSIKAPK